MIRQDWNRAYHFSREEGKRIPRIISLMRSPGLHAVLTYRFGRWILQQNRLVRWGLTPLWLLLYHRIRTKWGIELPRRTCVGPGLYIGHFGGIIVNEDTILGANCILSHGVTIGVGGHGSRRGCPTVGDNVYIGPGAKLFGKIRIGNNVSIGANAVVYRDVPDNAVVALSPGFSILFTRRPSESAASLHNTD